MEVRNKGVIEQQEVFVISLFSNVTPPIECDPLLCPSEMESNQEGCDVSLLLVELGERLW